MEEGKKLVKLDLNKLKAKDGVLKIQHETIEEEKLFYERPVNIGGTITAPANYITKRLSQHPEERCNVQYSYLKRVINLHTFENYAEFGSHITGALIVNPQIKEFGINENQKFGVKELTKHIRMNVFLFDDKAVNAKIVSGLQNFVANVNTDIKKINDNRGNIEDVFKTTLKSNAELAFNVNMPVFIGEPKKSFRVEIACEADNSGIRFWFESQDLIELLNNDTKAIIDGELKRFPETFVFIEQ